MGTLQDSPHYTFPSGSHQPFCALPVSPSPLRQFIFIHQLGNTLSSHGCLVYCLTSRESFICYNFLCGKKCDKQSTDNVNLVIIISCLCFQALSQKYYVLFHIIILCIQLFSFLLCRHQPTGLFHEVKIKYTLSKLKIIHGLHESL